MVQKQLDLLKNLRCSITTVCCHGKPKVFQQFQLFLHHFGTDFWLYVALLCLHFRFSSLSSRLYRCPCFRFHGKPAVFQQIQLFFCTILHTSDIYKQKKTRQRPTVSGALACLGRGNRRSLRSSWSGTRTKCSPCANAPARISTTRRP